MLPFMTKDTVTFMTKGTVTLMTEDTVTFTTKETVTSVTKETVTFVIKETVTSVTKGTVKEIAKGLLLLEKAFGVMEKILSMKVRIRAVKVFSSSSLYTDMKHGGSGLDREIKYVRLKCNFIKNVGHW